MNNKIKIFLILGIIVLFLIFLIIRNSEKKFLINNFLFNRNLKKVVENFQESCDEISDDMYCINSYDFKNNISNKKAKFLESMNRFYNDIGTDGIESNNINSISSTGTKIGDSNYYLLLSKPINDYLRNDDNTYFKLDNNSKYIYGPLGIEFDTINDDLIVFDLAVLRRFQLRNTRKLNNGEIQFKMDLEEVFLDNYMIRDKYFRYLSKFNEEYLKSNLNLGLPGDSANDKFNSDENERINYNKNSNFSFDIIARTLYPKVIKKIDDMLKQDSSNFSLSIVTDLGKSGVDDNKEKIFTNLQVFKYELESLRNLYLDKYLSKIESFNETCDNISEKECNKIKKRGIVEYQKDIPPYNIGLQGKGVQRLQFDYTDRTIYHPYMLDMKIRPQNNSWNDSKLNGIFRPDIKYAFNNNSENLIDETGVNKNEGIETFSGKIIVDNKKFFKLPNEMDSTGIGMYYDNVYNNVYVPDPENNRIQVFECLSKEFSYIGEFGNTDYVSYRSLPTYQGESLDTNKNPLIGGSTNYEPIFNTDEITDRETAGYRCDTLCNEEDINCYQKYMQHGPFDYYRKQKTGTDKDDTPFDIREIKLSPQERANLSEADRPSYNIYRYDLDEALNFEEEHYEFGGKSKDIKECNVDFSRRRVNISERGKKYGHFYHLLSEYESILSQNVKHKNNKSSYSNPHLLGVKVQMDFGNGTPFNTEDNGITAGSVAYRKFIFKTIMATDNGQKFGQLFKPRSIAFDDDSANNSGQKYYVVDTYHHCIQCFEKVDNIQTETGEKYSFKSSDEKFNDEVGFYLFNNKWESNYINYNTSEIYSLGVRQSLIDYEKRGLANEIVESFSNIEEGFVSSNSPRIKFGKWKFKIDELNPLDESILTASLSPSPSSTPSGFLNLINPYVNRIDPNEPKEIKMNLQDSPNNGIAIQILREDENDNSSPLTLPPNILANIASEEVVEGKYFITFTYNGHALRFKRITENFYELENLPLNIVLINYDNSNNFNPNVGSIYKSIYLDNEYGKKFGQTYTNPDTNDVKGVVKLSRWTSGRNDEYKNNDYKDISFEYPFYFTELAYDDSASNKELLRKKKNNPGTGEFLYPTDIVICDNPFKKEKLLMVSDMGNNRVCIFKKYSFKKLGKQYKRFRFFRFLNDTNTANEGRVINNPFSLTVNKFTGCVYVLEGNTIGNNNQKIKVYYPVRDNSSNNSSNLKYKFKNEIILDINTNNNKPVRATKIRIDDRGLLVVTDINNTCIHVIGEKLDINNQTGVVNELNNKKIMAKYESNLSKISFNYQINLMENTKFDDLNNNDFMLKLTNMNRLRFVFLRKNNSINANKYKILMTQEFKYDFNLIDKSNFEASKKKNLIAYDKLEDTEFKNFWGSRSYGHVIPLESNDINYNEKTVTNTTELNMNVYKQFINIKHKFQDKENLNTVLDGYEDWIGDRLRPNCNYGYRYGIYNYTNVSYLKDEDKEINTIPIAVTPDDIEIYSNNNNINTNYVNFRINYGRISKLHYETEKYNPICYYILRMKHNRSKDGMLKYLNVKRGEMIQLILPDKSKFIANKFSKPKYGKLHVYNAYGSGTVREQRKLMQENVYYSNSKFIIFYSAEGGIKKDGGMEKIPNKNLIKNNFIDDFFVMGDNNSTPYAKTYFRVRINISDDGNSNNVIMLNDIENLESNLSLYSKNIGKRDDYTLKKIFKLAAYKNSNDSNNYYYPGNGVKFCDRGTLKEPIEHNQTYEYCILTCNPFIMNPAVNTFFYTTKPEKVYIPQTTIEKVIVAGEEKNYLKVIWYTPKNSGIYWPYNFLILRKETNRDIPERITPLKIDINLETLQLSNNELKIFEQSKNGIRLKSSYSSNTTIFEKSFDLGSLDQWKITFGPFSMDEQGNNNNKTFYINNNEFEWRDRNRSYKFKGRQLRLKIELSKKEMLRQFRVEKTIIIKDYDEISNELEEERQKEEEKIREKTQKDLEKMEEDMNLEKRKEYLRIYEAYRKRQKIGFAFSLSDDYNPDPESKYVGYSGELYTYLNSLDEPGLLNIFDELNDKIVILKGDVNMRMDGPQGMLRSGGRDILIDKIRHLSYLLRNGTKDVNNKLGVVCNDLKLEDLISSQSLNNVTECINKNILNRKSEERKRIEKERDEKIKKIENIKKIRQQAARQKERLQQRILESSIQDRSRIENKINELNTKMEDYNKEQQKFEEQENTRRQEEEGQIVSNMLVEQGTELLYNEPELRNLFITYKDSLKIDVNNLKFNKSYIGKKEGLIEGEDVKYTVPMEVFLSDLALGISDSETIRESYNKFHGMVYDFRRSELKFIKKGENPILHPEKIVSVANMLIIPINQGELAIPAQNKIKEIKKIERKIQKMKVELKTAEDVNVKRLEEYKKAIEISEKMKLSPWSFIKDDKPEKFIEEPLQGEKLNELIKDYSIEPSTVKLASSEITGEELFNHDANLKNITNDNLRKKIIEEKYIGHKQMIDLGRDYINIKYEYRICVYQTGYNFKNTDARTFMGMNYYDYEPEYATPIVEAPTEEGFESNINSPEFSNLNIEENKEEESHLPYLNIGEVYSDPFYAGTVTENVKQITIPNIPIEAPNISTMAKKEDRPVIKFFEPKEGYENTIVRIVGTRLEELEYICFRDIKVNILRKTKRKVKKEGKTEIYDELFVKPPTLKELDKECWQSLERYKVLVWGYFRKSGVQIRSSEGIENGTNTKNLMYTYNTRTTCSDKKKLKVPK